MVSSTVPLSVVLVVMMMRTILMILSNTLLIIMNMYVASWGKLLIWVKLVNLAKLLGEALENLNSRISIQIFFQQKRRTDWWITNQFFLRLWRSNVKSSYQGWKWWRCCWFTWTWTYTSPSLGCFEAPARYCFIINSLINIQLCEWLGQLPNTKKVMMMMRMMTMMILMIMMMMFLLLMMMMMLACLSTIFALWEGAAWWSACHKKFQSVLQL